MKLALIVGLFAICVVAESLTESDTEQEWTLYKSKFNKNYEYHNEDVLRRNVYFENKMKMIDHNKLYEKGDVTYEMGINIFSDLTDDEVVDTNSCVGNSKEMMGSLRSKKMMGSTSSKQMKELSFNYDSASKLGRIPREVDWRRTNCVTGVKNQGKCRSCWAFNAIDIIESVHCIFTKDLTNLSVQMLVDCSKNDNCQGGWTHEALEWIKQNGGIASADDYPYESADGWVRTCLNDTKRAVIIDDYHYSIGYGNETELLNVVINRGPVAVAIKLYADFFRYTSGVYYSELCANQTYQYEDLNMGLVAVGYGTESKGKDYWILKSALGEDWGDKGYIKMARNRDNHCGIADYVIYL